MDRGLDQTTLGVEEDEDVDEPRDRAYWQSKASNETLQLTDQLLELVHELEPDLALKYNKTYIGLSRNGIATNFVSFRPRKHHVLVEFKIPRSEELTQELEDAGMDVMTYQTRWGRYGLHVDGDDLAERSGALRKLVAKARDSYGF